MTNCVITQEAIEEALKICALCGRYEDGKCTDNNEEYRRDFSCGRFKNWEEA